LDHCQSYEQKLWHALKEGDHESFGELYNLFYRPLYTYGRQFLTDADLVEDAVQDLFVYLWNSRHKLSDVVNVKYYLFRALRRDVYRTYKKEKRLSAVDADSSFSGQVETYVFEQEEQEKQLTLKLTKMLRELPERQFEVISLRFYENFQTHEIASIMGISEKSVRNTLYKALTHLRQHVHYLAPFLEILLLWFFV
jgi:RNA polymerase sigma-70 factor (ECF subfamily)